ncbi:hypothetical protein [Sphingomonas sp. R86520]|uniref:hypothetical protein n=1 Tax=Sphingomonas sp. R86520 TaxID=3093859 RepID=UPI0036D2F8A8
MSFGWEPIPWKLGFLRSRSMKCGFHERIRLPLEWQPAQTYDWPPEDALSDDLDWIRAMGTGFIAEARDERFFLFDRDWFGWPDPPEWGFASFHKGDGKWHLWGSFDTLPENWKVPRVEHAEN